MSLTRGQRKYKKTVAEYQKGKCYYCQCFMWMVGHIGRKEFVKLVGLPANAPRKLVNYRQCTLEHLDPVCNNGTSRRHNLVAACRWCNEKRGDHSVAQWKMVVQQLIEEGKHPHYGRT